VLQWYEFVAQTTTASTIKEPQLRNRFSENSRILKDNIKKKHRKPRTRMFAVGNDISGCEMWTVTVIMQIELGITIL